MKIWINAYFTKVIFKQLFSEEDLLLIKSKIICIFIIILNHTTYRNSFARPTLLIKIKKSGKNTRRCSIAKPPILTDSTVYLYR